MPDKTNGGGTRGPADFPPHRDEPEAGPRHGRRGPPNGPPHGPHRPPHGPHRPHHGPHGPRGPHGPHDHSDIGDVDLAYETLAAEVGEETAGIVVRFMESQMPPHLRAKVEEGVADIVRLREILGPAPSTPSMPALAGEGAAFLWQPHEPLAVEIVEFLQLHCGKRGAKLAEWLTRGPEPERVLSLVGLIRSQLIVWISDGDAGHGGRHDD